MINLLIIAASLYIVIKKVMRAMKKEEKVSAPAVPPAQEVLLSEIRDLLKKDS